MLSIVLFTGMWRGSGQLEIGILCTEHISY